MNTILYVGLDIHKKTVSYCVRKADGQIAREGAPDACRKDLVRWIQDGKEPWTARAAAPSFPAGWRWSRVLPAAPGIGTFTSLPLAPGAKTVQIRNTIFPNWAPCSISVMASRAWSSGSTQLMTGFILDAATARNMRRKSSCDPRVEPNTWSWFQ